MALWKLSEVIKIAQSHGNPTAQIMQNWSYVMSISFITPAIHTR